MEEQKSNDIIKILVVDDDSSNNLAIETLIRIHFPDIKVFLAFDGLEAFNIAQNEYPDIIISDITMPKMNGFELLTKIRSRNELSDAIFIFLTASVEDDIYTHAIEIGADDFLGKPIESNRLLVRIRSSLRIINLKRQVRSENKLLMELAEALENDMQDMIKLAVKFLEARIPASIDMLKRVSQCSVWIMKNLSEYDEESLRDIEIASFLSQAGRIFLPDSMLKMPVLIDGAPTDPLMCQVPQSGKAIVESINRFRHVALIIGHIYENFDGSGIPERLKSWQIPLESRIIRASLDFEELRVLRNLSSKNAIEILRKESQRLYDNRVIILLEQYLKSHDKELFDPFEMAVQLAELKEGMIITRDIYTNKGLKLIPSGATLSTKTIERLISHNSTDPILGNVHVKKG